MPTRQEQEAINFLRRMDRGDSDFWIRQVLQLYRLPETDEMVAQIRMEATKAR